LRVIIKTQEHNSRRLHHFLMESRYYVSLKKSDEGYSVWVPGLPGCASQGTDEQEALENIQDAIQEYLAVAESLTEAGEKREVVVSR
jgi:predicted RNase H-like HicB family nuclease